MTITQRRPKGLAASGDGAPLRVALPSKGMEDDTLAFLKNCGLAVERSNARQYRANLRSLKQVEVTFQRASDIFAKVDEGSVDLGITGYDVVAEYREDDNVIVVIPGLGYGRCALALGIPEHWIDVSSIADLAEVSSDWHAKGRDLRVATKYANLTRQFLYDHGVNYFTLVESSGALEAAPSLGYADLIADLTSSGVTLRENRLKTIPGGTILPSEACLIANRAELRSDPEKLERTRHMVELMEAGRRSRSYLSLTANVRGGTAETVARQVTAHGEIAGLRGPTVARVYPKSLDDDDEEWYAVTVIVMRDRLLEAVDALRRAGATDATAVPLAYVFESRAWAFEALLRALGEERQVDSEG